jgi:hypothetical protein
MSIDERVDVSVREEGSRVQVDQEEIGGAYQLQVGQEETSGMDGLKEDILANLRDRNKPRYLNTEGKSVTLYG